MPRPTAGQALESKLGNWVKSCEEKGKFAERDRKEGVSEEARVPGEREEQAECGWVLGPLGWGEGGNQASQAQATLNLLGSHPKHSGKPCPC